MRRIKPGSATFPKRIPHTALLTGRGSIPVFSALGPTVSIPPMSYAFFYQEERRGIPKSLPSESVDSVGVSVECNRRLNGLAEGAVACSRTVSASLHG